MVADFCIGWNVGLEKYALRINQQSAAAEKIAVQ